MLLCKKTQTKTKPQSTPLPSPGQVYQNHPLTRTIHLPEPSTYQNHPLTRAIHLPEPLPHSNYLKTGVQNHRGAPKSTLKQGTKRPRFLSKKRSRRSSAMTQVTSRHPCICNCQLLHTTSPQSPRLTRALDLPEPSTYQSPRLTSAPGMNTSHHTTAGPGNTIHNRWPP
jgi:hypothetical protein